LRTKSAGSSRISASSSVTDLPGARRRHPSHKAVDRGV
jgi:hypothetical protein